MTKMKTVEALADGQDVRRQTALLEEVAALRRDLQALTSMRDSVEALYTEKALQMDAELEALRRYQQLTREDQLQLRLLIEKPISEASKVLTALREASKMMEADRKLLEAQSAEARASLAEAARVQRWSIALLATTTVLLVLLVALTIWR